MNLELEDILRSTVGFKKQCRPTRVWISSINPLLPNPIYKTYTSISSLFNSAANHANYTSLI